ncbi:PadR family transcriptional regulator [Roseomonas sp. CCTCC AB2023176]|uniref:PadR family transcriptional regulator n=1 Tax=Roseomonas sp. CCTCC AB2023176 TaxID=3342640 RepID=UPI0035D85A2A
MPRSGKTRGRRPGDAAALTTADLVVLSLLAERPMHGYDLLAEYGRQEVEDWASVSKAQLYYALTKLAEAGLIAGRTEPGASRERTVFAPTPAGLAVLATALADPAWARARVAQPFTTWLGLSMHAAPDAVRQVLAERRAFLDREIAKERDSLAFILTLPGERATRGAAIVRLVLRQLEVEREWVADLQRAPG